MDGNNPRDKSTRRTALKTVGMMGLATAGVPGMGAAATQDNIKTFRITDKDVAETEVKELRKVGGISVTETPNAYVVRANPAKLGATKAEKRKAAQAVQNVRRDVDSQVEKSVNAAAEKAFNDDSDVEAKEISPAYSATYYNMTQGDKGGSSSGISINVANSHYDLVSDEATSATVTGTIGVSGSVTRWAWVGVPFTSNDSASVNVTADGEAQGLLSAAGSTSAHAQVQLRVKNQTNGTEFRDNIVNKSGGGYSWETISEDFNTGLSMDLTEGNDYLAYVYLETGVTAAGAGEAGSDFGPEDGDGADTQRLWINGISVSE